tara:strand:- start:1031 stop:1609 length:579 start_codon:yes stop_codon:yes gene_type:complete
MKKTPKYNKGHRFEMQVAESFGVQSPLGGHGSDLELDGFSVEVKNGLSVDFGQGSMVASKFGWQSVAKSPYLQGLFVETGMDVELTAIWGDEGIGGWYIPGTLGDVKIEAPNDAAARYYAEKGDAYVYIGSHGLYRTGDEDPANTGAPLLSGTCILRSRIKCHSKSRAIYRPNYAIRIISLEKSPFGLDELR